MEVACAYEQVVGEKLLDDISDVNEGESHVMKMWNRHILTA